MLFMPHYSRWITKINCKFTQKLKDYQSRGCEFYISLKPLVYLYERFEWSYCSKASQISATELQFVGSFLGNIIT